MSVEETKPVLKVMLRAKTLEWRQVENHKNIFSIPEVVDGRSFTDGMHPIKPEWAVIGQW